MTEQAAAQPKPTTTGAPPPGAAGGGASPPPYTGAGFPLRHGLVRPKQGRYLAGVCAAIGRATNTDPVLWRVLLAVLGFFGGIGLLVYVAVWLASPAEGDSASPVEALLGRGRSGTSPILVIILGMLVALMFGFIVTDGFRAALLGAAVLIGGALLLNRNTGDRAPRPAPAGGSGPGTWATAAEPPPGPATWAAATGPTPSDTAASQPLADAPTAPQESAHTEPTLVDGVPRSGPTDEATTPAPPPPPPEPIWPAPPAGPPARPPAYPGVPGPGGHYRPPFAPHGPYGGGPPPPFPPPTPPAPKPPKERSSLGAGTFSLIFVALGVVAALDLSGAIDVGPSAYFAGALVTVALGLLVGAWFGRARWLIALGLVLSVALGISTTAEYVDEGGGNVGTDVMWRPASPDEMAERYENNFGSAVLDLRAIDFNGRDEQVTVEVNWGELDVILPPDVDVTANVEVDAGDATVFNNNWGGFDNTGNEVIDLGANGRGGGTLRLDVHVSAGNVEVYR